MANTTTQKDTGTGGTHYATGGPHKRMDEGIEKAKGIAEKAKDTAGSVLEQARDTAANVAQGAGRVASNVANYVGETAENATEAVGHGMKSLGSTIREKGPESGFLGSASSTVAGALENAGGYLEEEGLSGIGRDVTNLIRRYPIAAIAVGVCMGFMIARATRA
jgi:hypothetical protein